MARQAIRPSTLTRSVSDQETLPDQLIFHWLAFQLTPS